MGRNCKPWHWFQSLMGQPMASGSQIHGRFSIRLSLLSCTCCSRLSRGHN